METVEAGQTAKTPKIRSVAYPSYLISACVHLTQRIDDEFTDVVYTPKENISKNLGTSGGALDRNLSSCVQYGILELKKTLGYKPTELFKKIKRPLPDENVNDLLRQCLQGPELYKKLITEFNGKKLPSATGLSNILDRLYGVKGEAADKAAKTFLKNLSALELIGPDSVLQLEGGITEIEDVEQEEYEEQELQSNEKPQPSSQQTVLLLPQNQSPTQHQQPVNNKETKEIPVFLKNSREAKILLPSDFDDDDILKVAKVLKGYLPD